MCGICGIYHYRRGEPADPAVVRDMTEAITHRGPDDDGYHVDGPLGLGMRRLSIIDLEGGAQPIRSDRGSWVVFNGEIYNFQDLRRRLQAHGHRFATRTDTETIVRGFDQWGFDVLRRLNGMFGIALWDETTRTLLLARDPFGIKPLYYRDDGSSLAFGSEIRSILCVPGVPRELDRPALDAYLSFTYVPSPATAFAGIRKVPPGHALVCTPDSCRVRRFHFSAPRQLDDRKDGVLVAELQELILAAVRRQMVADVPVGALLSGGVDSTTIATIMSELAGRPIDTFTVGFSGGPALDERTFAGDTARRIGSRQHDLVISPEEYESFLPRSVWHLEDLVATDSTLAYYKVCEMARMTVKVVLSGQGADEPFAGYPRHLGERYGFLYRGLPSGFRDTVVSPLVAALPRNLRLKRAVRSLGDPDPRRRMLAVWTVVDAGQKRRLYGAGTPIGEEAVLPGAVWQRDVAHLDAFTQMLYCDARTSLADNLLLYGDKMSMAVSLEARVPLLDLELMRFVESLPPRLKIRGRTRKYILRQAVRRWVPDEVLRRKKIPFESPLDHWLRTDLVAGTRELLLSEGSASREHFEVGELRRLIDDHVRGRENNNRLLLALMVFELWYRQFIAPSPAALRARLLGTNVAGGAR